MHVVVSDFSECERNKHSFDGINGACIRVRQFVLIFKAFHVAFCQFWPVAGLSHGWTDS